MGEATEISGAPPGPRAGGRVAAAGRVLAAAALAGGLLWTEGRRADSVLPGWDETALAVMQKFLPGDGRTSLVLESAPGPDVRVFAPPVAAGDLPVMLVEFREDEASALLQWPPGPLDLAVVLNALAQSGATGVALAQAQGVRPSAGTLAGRAYGSAREALGGIPVVAGCEPGQSIAPPDDAAAEFARLPSIPLSRVHGDAAMIPEVNDPGPLPAAGAGDLESGFSRLLGCDVPAGPPGRVGMPMVARAGDRVLPSLPLLLAARAIGADVAEAEVRLGKAILLGGLAVPIDGRGYLHVPASHLRRIGRISPLELARGDGAGSAGSSPEAIRGRYVVVGQESGGAGGAGESPAGRVAAVLGALASGDFGQPVRVLRRAPGASVLAVCGLFAAGAVLVLPLPRRQRLAAAALMGTLYFLATRHAIGSLGVFHGMVVPVGVYLAAFGVALRQARP